MDIVLTGQKPAVSVIQLGSRNAGFGRRKNAFEVIQQRLVNLQLQVLATDEATGCAVVELLGVEQAFCLLEISPAAALLSTEPRLLSALMRPGWR